MSRTPTVTVVIPVFDHARYLAAAIASAVEQSHPPAEIIVVDDGSTDGSGEVADGFGPPVRVLRQAHAGPSAARNLGIADASGSHIALLDSDDVWAPQKLERQLAACAAAGDDALVFGMVEEFLDPGVDPEHAARIRPPIDSMPGICVSALLARTTVFRRVGPFAAELVVGEWADWVFRATDLGLETVVVPEVVVRRRLHNENQGLRAAESRGLYLQVVKAALDRRRAAATDAPGTAPVAGAPQDADGS